jgi:hypothetical protein
MPNKVWFNKLELKWSEILKKRKKVIKRYKSQTFNDYNNLIQCFLLSNNISNKKKKEKVSKFNNKELLKFY